MPDNKQTLTQLRQDLLDNIKLRHGYGYVSSATELALRGTADDRAAVLAIAMTVISDELRSIEQDLRPSAEKHLGYLEVFLGQSPLDLDFSGLENIAEGLRDVAESIANKAK